MQLTMTLNTKIKCIHSLLLCVIFKGMIGDRKSRNATTLFLVSLSAADLLLLLVCAPVYKQDLHIAYTCYHLYIQLSVYLFPSMRYVLIFSWP